MYQNPRQISLGGIAPASALCSVIAERDQLATTGIGEAARLGVLEVARQRRAEHLAALIGSTRRNWRPLAYWLLILTAALAGSRILLGAYATLLSWQNVPVSISALAAVLLAAGVSSIAGFAFSAICGAILLQMMNDPVEAVQIMMVCSIAIQSLSIAVLWRDVDWRTLPRFIAGGAVGLPIGVWLLLHLGHAGFNEAMGGLLIAYASYRMLRRPFAVTSAGGLADTCVGLLGGITGGLAGFPGAAVTIWCGMRGWDKHRQRGIYQPYILVMQILALLLIQVMRRSAAHGAGLHLGSLAFVPVALLGTWFGLVIFHRLPDRHFAMAVNVLLLVSGVGLLA